MLPEETRDNNPCINCGSDGPCNCFQEPKLINKIKENKVMSNEMREFSTGATRNSDVGKFDYEGFISPLVLERYGEYMNKHRYQADGKVRDSDNWQKGIPKTAYIKSAWRHFVDWWKQHRGLPGQDTLEDSMCALMFNVMGYLHEVLKEKTQNESVKKD